MTDVLDRLRDRDPAAHVRAEPPAHLLAQITDTPRATGARSFPRLEFTGGIGNRRAKFDFQPDGKTKVTLEFQAAINKKYKEYKEFNLEGFRTFNYKY